MRYGILMVLAVFVVVTGMVYVFAQDRPPEGNSPRPGGRFGPRPGMGPEDGDRPMRPSFMPGPGAAAVMELSGNALFLVSGTTVYKINTSEMKLVATRDLTEAGQSKKSAAGMFIKKFDTDRDGKISENEFTGPPYRFEKMDSNADGFVTKDEIPPELLARARRVMRKPMLAGPVAIKVGTTSLFVYLGGILYKLKVSDLVLQGSLELDEKEFIPGKDRKRSRRKKGEDERPWKKRKKKDNDDFGF